MSMTGRRACIVVFVVACAAAAPAEAQNLLTNPGFNDNTNGWIGSATFDGTRNHPGSSGNGSARFVPTPGFLGFFDAVQQCIPVVAGTEYSLGASMMVDAHPANNDIMQAQFAFFTGANCSVSVAGETTLAANSASVGWVTQETVMVAPPGSVSLRVLGRLQINTDAPQAANYDDFFVIAEEIPVPTLPVTMFILLAMVAIGVGIIALKRQQLRAA